ncbi:MAG: SpoIIE family protein phosphatase [Planctomycetota bacterium]
MAEPQANERPTVLVVDDEDAIRFLLLQALRETDEYDLLEAADGEQAKQVLQEHDVDVAVTDLIMPRLGGLELMQWAQENRPGTYWIILSGRGTFEDAIRAIQLGAFDFVTKPLPSMDTLTVSVRNAARQKRLEAERGELLEEVEARNEQLSEQVEQLCEACRLLGDQAQTINDDLRRAELIQRAMLPTTPPNTGEFAVDALYRTSQNVGGDLYDVVRVGDRYLIAYVADAAGHGVSAAMLAVLFKHRLHMIEEEGSTEPTPPATVLELVNRHLMEECRAPALFVTAAYCVLDMHRRELTVASAGHCPLLLRRADGQVERIHHTGPALGLRPKAPYAEKTMLFEPEDRLLMYTDGLLEYQDNEPLMTVDRIVEMLSRSELTGKDLLDALLAEALPEGDAQQQDDVTVVLLCGAQCASTIDNGELHTQDGRRTGARPPAAAVLLGQAEGATVFSIQGDLNWMHGGALHDRAMSELRQRHEVLLDMSLCFHLDSTMLGTIQELSECADELGTRFEIQGLLPQVQATFEELDMQRSLSHVIDHMRPLPSDMHPISAEEAAPGGHRVLRAHEVLASLSESNQQQFGRLIEMLRKEVGSES